MMRMQGIEATDSVIGRIYRFRMAAVMEFRNAGELGLDWQGQFMRTAIIGGGIAGLAAAFELEKAGTEYTLFEAGRSEEHTSELQSQ